MPIVSLQYCMSILPVLRMNIDYLFCFKVEANDNMMRLYKSYFPVRNFKVFQQLLRKCTNNFSSLFLNSQSASTVEGDVLRWYRGNPALKVKLGLDSMWQFMDKVLVENAPAAPLVEHTKENKKTKKTKVQQKGVELEHTESDEF